MNTATTPERYDIAVIGGGPAGAAAAIRAGRAGLSVVVFEKGKHGRDKVHTNTRLSFHSYLWRRTPGSLWPPLSRFESRYFVCRGSTCVDLKRCSSAE